MLSLHVLSAAEGSAVAVHFTRSPDHPITRFCLVHFVREDDESMKPPSNVKTPAQYIASLPADPAKTIATVRVSPGCPLAFPDI